MQDIIDHLEYSNENDIKELNVELDVYTQEGPIQERFQQKIRFIKQVDWIDDIEPMPIDETTDTFPELPYDEIEINNFSSTYTIHELATYGQCPLRHYLEYVLKMTPLSGDQDI